MTGTLTFLLVAAASQIASFPDFPVQPASNYRVSATKSGITVAIHPVVDSKEQKTYFGFDLTKKGYIPILVVVGNSYDGSVLLIKDRASVYRPAAALEPGSAPTARTRQGEALMITDGVLDAAVNVGYVVFAGVGGAGNPVPLGLMGDHMASQAVAVQHNLLKKELQSRTLPRGTSAHGFIFARVPKKFEGPLLVRIELTGSGQTDSLRFDLATAPLKLE